MRQFGLLGYPLGHSFSKGYFSEKFAKEGLNDAYDNFAMPSIDLFPQLIDSHPDLAGLNVTIPYKEAVIPFLNELDEEAKAIHAVNTIKISRSESGTVLLKGYNTDLIGFRESIRPLINQLLIRCRQKGDETIQLKALILGTGGASKAICYGLRQLDIDTLYVSRTSRQWCITYDQLTEATYSDYRIIVNATPLGMNPNINTYPELDYHQIGSGHLLYDAVYNPE
ncbi:MAG: shikimate dehydrogenase, partial [Bacteroidota bacterium]|nr:shikimate dehydrogenase [Bacteroidota bacterium]